MFCKESDGEGCIESTKTELRWALVAVQAMELYFCVVLYLYAFEPLFYEDDDDVEDDDNFENIDKP